MRVHLCRYLGEFTPTLEDVARLTTLPMFGKATLWGIVLEEDDGVKLKNLTSAMTPSRTSGKSTYATWLNFFYKGDGSRSGLWWKPSWHIGCLVRAAECPRGWLESVCFSSSHLGGKGDPIHVGLTLTWVPICTTSRVPRQYGLICGGSNVVIYVDSCFPRCSYGSNICLGSKTDGIS